MVWISRNVQYLGIDIRLSQAVSDKVVDKFVKDLRWLDSQVHI